jgi:hypothetical protein
MVAVVPLGFDSFEAVRPYSSHSTVTVAYGRFWFDGFPSPATCETFVPPEQKRFGGGRSKSRPIQVLSVRKCVTHDPESRVLLVSPQQLYSPLYTPGSSSTRDLLEFQNVKEMPTMTNETTFQHTIPSHPSLGYL